MKKFVYSYFYFGDIISGESFKKNVPLGWENELVNDEYHYGGFKAVRHDPTYDVHFNNEQDSNNKGFTDSYNDCLSYIEEYNGTDHSYFEDYKGGTVSIVCNETGEVVYEVEVK
ncbi:MAG: hypothetical protein PHV07_09655 [Oscillospiraceae bacterium]|nr:hypothetical protein [Oscillospiraceae bacterium]